MDASAQFLITLGGILFVGLLTSEIGRRTFLPRVTLLLLFGIAIGKEALDIVPDMFAVRFELIADMALLMVGFLIGGKLTKESLQYSANKILWISLSASLMTAITVSLGLSLINVPLEISILLGCIASATAPATVLDVVYESENRGRFKQLLLAIVALDDAWALILFGSGMAVVTSLSGHDPQISVLWLMLHDIGGALLLGLVIGVPAAYLTGRIKQGQPMLTEALGLVFISGGLALWLDVSFLLTAMTIGAVIANLARHHDYPFHAIEGVEWPFMVVFFVLAGALLELNAIHGIGLIGIVFIICRIAGKYLGARIGSQFSGVDSITKKWVGLALLPQAGVNIGMALVAANQFPEYRQTLLSIVIGSTVFFEVIGPIFTRMALTRVNT